MNTVCEAFGCTPSEALEIDPKLAFPILEARMARVCMDYHKDDITKMPPKLVTFWRELTNG